MNCLNCGFPLESEVSICPNCHQNPRIAILPPEEHENFNGLTIEPEIINDKNQHNNTGPHVFVRRIQFGGGRNNFLSRFLIGLFLLILVIVALPLALIIIGFFLVSMVFGRRIK